MKWPWSRSKPPEHMTRAEKKRIDEGQGDTAIARAVNRSRTTIYRYRWTLQQEHAHTAAEQQTVELQRKLVERFVKSIDNLKPALVAFGVGNASRGRTAVGSRACHQRYRCDVAGGPAIRSLAEDSC